MSSSRRRIPKYRHYKPKHLGVVRIAGRDHYLGRYDSPESWEKYHRLIAEWLSQDQSHGGDQADAKESSGSLSVNELLLRYWGFVESYYVKDGQPTTEQSGVREAIWPLRHLYGATKGGEFGPKALRAVRQYMIDEQDLSRKVINQRIGRIKRLFKWAVAEELVPLSIHHGLQAVAGLRFGRTKARETEPVKPVDDKHVDAVLPYLTPQHRIAGGSTRFQYPADAATGSN